MFGDEIKSIKFGAASFFSIALSNPLPIETTRNKEGIMPRSVDQKKFIIFTLNRHGKTFCI